MSLDPMLLEILACPEDKGPLLYFDDEAILYNPRLHRAYEVRDGIPVMLVDEARQLDDAEQARLIAKAGAEGIKPNFTAGDQPPDSGGTATEGRPAADGNAG